MAKTAQMKTEAKEKKESQTRGAVDALPVFGQAKILYQFLMGDAEGARNTWHWNSLHGVGTSQLCSVYECSKGDFSGARRRQCAFFSNASEVVATMPESVPMLGHLVAISHCCGGDRKRGYAAERKATRSCVVLTAGAATVPAAAALAAACGHSFIWGGAAMKATAMAASCAAGKIFDKHMLANHVHSVPRPLSHGDKFDMIVLCFLDALRGLIGCELGLLLMPDVVTEVAVYTEPLTTANLVHLATGRHMPDMLDFDSGAVHVFVKVTTVKGHSYITERLSDGSIVVDGDHGHMAMSYIEGGPNTFVSQAEARFDHPILFAKAELENANPFFAPHASDLQTIAKAESMLPYNLVSANCQHYANDVYGIFTGTPLSHLPNSWPLELARTVVEPGRAMMSAPSCFSSLLQCLSWTVRNESLVSLGAPLVATTIASSSPEVLSRIPEHQSARV